MKAVPSGVCTRVLSGTLLCFALALSGELQAGTIYVTTNGTGSGTAGWADATSLANALTVAQDGDELWIAQGTYAGTTFAVAADLALYGGFTNGMAGPGDRNPALFPAVLDGEASRRVVEITGTNVTLDGLTVRNGKISGHGVGISKTSAGSLTMRNCSIAGNTAGTSVNHGIGAYFTAGAVSLTNCTFADNQPVLHRSDGYGVYASGADLTVVDCLFSNNWPGTGGRMTWGAGLYFAHGSLSLSGSSFIRNRTRCHTSTRYGGGAAYIGAGSTAEVRNCVFSGNVALADTAQSTIAYGGAMFLDTGAGPTVTVENCTLVDNAAGTDGGALYVASGDLLVQNSIVWSNAVTGGAGDELYVAGGGAATVTYTCLTGTGSDDLFGNIARANILTADPLFATNDLSDVHLRSSAGRWNPASGSFVIDPGILSPCIDAGNPASAFSREPAGADGGRINLGAYGNTPEASKSPAAIAPAVVNLGAVTAFNIATLSGKLTSGTVSDVTFFWGTNASNLEYSQDIYPPQPTGTVFSTTEIMLPSRQYYFACYATNPAGESWSATNGFTSGPLPPGGGPGIIHVDRDATQPEDGTSWHTAYRTLAAAVAAVEGTTNRIWVADGTYTEGGTLTLAGDVSIYGGFAGTETNLSDRSLADESVLNGAGGYRVLSVSGTSVVLDGLSVSNGYATDHGVGIAKTGAGALTLRNCRIARNKMGTNDRYGIGAYFAGGSVTLTNCAFVDNEASSYRTYGYGFYASGANLVVADCLFSNNWQGSAGRMTWGGGFYFANGSLDVSGSSFIDNRTRGHTTTKYGGSGAYVGAGSTATFKNCVFRGNESVIGSGEIAYGGALFFDTGAAPTATVENCTLVDNFAKTDGGACYVASGNLMVKNCIVWSNRADVGTGNQVYCAAGATARISYGCLSGTGGDDVFGTVAQANVITSDPLFAADFTDVHLKSFGGRWDPATQTFVTDPGALSPCLDTGDPGSDYSREPNVPAGANGGRINLGAYGNTPEASKSPATTAPQVAARGVDVSFNVATMKGELLDGTTSEVTAYWGTNASILDSSQSLAGLQTTGVLFSVSRSLLPNRQYHYAWRAVNAGGDGWSATNAFMTGARGPGGGPSVIHVDTDATQPQDGMSWYTAFRSLSAGVAAVNGATNEIWIAAGTYREGAAVAIATNMSVYGGFDGTETNRGDRSLTNEVILDGVGTFRVLSVTGSNVVLDGVSITDGVATDHGAGLAKTGGGVLAMRNCRVFANSGGGPSVKGVGAYFGAGSVTLTNCTFSDNKPGEYGNQGYGFYASGADVSVLDCLFSNNWYQSSDMYYARMTYGGGICFRNGSLSVSGSSFTGNRTPGHTFTRYGGSGAYIGAGSTATVRNCVFRDNRAVAADGLTIAYGGALFFDTGNAPTATVENCTLADNFAQTDGGAFYVASGTVLVKNCIAWSNSVTDGTGHELLATNAASAVTISYTDLTGTNPPSVAAGGGAALSWGSGIISVDPLFASDADLHLRSKAGRWAPSPGLWTSDQETSPCIDAGDPNSSVAREPSPNGRRINLGAYGNTPYASKTVLRGSIVIVR